MADIILRQMDYIFFFCGAALIILAAACFVIKRLEGQRLPWVFLGLFGLFHGLHEWLMIVKPLFDENSFFQVFDNLLITSSYLFLLEFGRGGFAVLEERTPGRWIFIPLLAFCILGWLAAGRSGFTAVSELLIGLPGGFLAAAMLLTFSLRLAALPRYLLMSCSLMMALFATGIAFALTDITGIPFFNVAAFLRQQGLPGELLRGLICLGMAFSVSLYSQLSVHMDANLQYFAERSRHVFWASVLLMVFILIAGWLMTRYFGERAASELKNVADSRAEMLENQVNSLLTIVDQDVMAMSELPNIVQAVTSGGENSRNAEAVLDYYKWMRKWEICYLLDGRGRVVASSNRYHPDSIVGQDFSRHPYVKESMTGVGGRYLAFDLVTKGRGFHSSYPIYNRQKKVIGVAAVKINLDELEVNLVTQPDFAFLISREGIIFLASHSDYIRMSLWPLSGKVIGELTASRQFGADSFQAVLQREPHNGQDAAFRGGNCIVTRRIINHEGWSLVLLSSTQQIIIYRLFGITISMLLCLLTVGFFIMAEKSLESAAHVAVSENRFRIIFENAPVAIFIVDMRTHKIISTNNFMADWLGYGKEEIFNLDIGNIRIAEEDAAGEYRYIKRDGAVIFAEEVRQPLPYYGQTADLIIAHDISERKKAEDLLYTLSMSDGLTEIANRRRFDEFLKQEWRRAMRDGTTISLLMCDIDFFKNFNDAYGHQAGDDCLKRVAGLIRDIFRRPGDIVARYGGEEFAVVMAGTEARGAVSLANAVRVAVEAMGIPHAGSSIASVVTLSIGAAAVVPSAEKSPEELIAAADNALYRAKSEGRNRVKSSSFPTSG